MRTASGIAIACAMCFGLFASGAAARAGEDGSCRTGQIRTASGCTGFAAAGREVRKIVNQAVRDDDLRAVLARVDVGDRTLAAISPGHSMAGVPANLRMHFRIGSIAIPYLIDVLLQLQDRGRLSLDDPVSRWFPRLPNASSVTLRMLASASSGYPDWIQGNPSFLRALLADPFRQWTEQQLLDAAFSQPLICHPGACFHYAHTGFVILGRVAEKVTRTSLARLMRTRVFRPLGLRNTDISALPAIPQPVLHSYIDDRGPYEDSTYWSPSWGISKGLLMTSTIADVIKSAKALGSAALVSRKASRQRIAPITAGLTRVPAAPPFSHRSYYGLGVLVANGWEFQNPDLNGWTSIMAVLPSRRIAIALSVTEDQRAAGTPTNYSQQLLGKLTAYLTPTHPVAQATS
jgi:CubicO group peptidase (beta-lactamase class C family)